MLGKIFAFIWKGIVGLFMGAQKIVVASVGPSLDLLLKSGGAILVDAAREAVAAAEQAGGTGDSKYDAAFKAVIEVLEDESIAVVKNAVNIAIENAVAELKALKQ